MNEDLDRDPKEAPADLEVDEQWKSLVYGCCNIL